jgi:hypothetical protein
MWFFCRDCFFHDRYFRLDRVDKNPAIGTQLTTNREKKMPIDPTIIKDWVPLVAVLVSFLALLASSLVQLKTIRTSRDVQMANLEAQWVRSQVEGLLADVAEFALLSNDLARGFEQASRQDVAFPRTPEEGALQGKGEIVYQRILMRLRPSQPAEGWRLSASDSGTIESPIANPSRGLLQIQVLDKYRSQEQREQ